jgi:hypothetical protein
MKGEYMNKDIIEPIKNTDSTEYIASAGSAIVSAFEISTPFIKYSISEIFSGTKRDERNKKLIERANRYLDDKVELFKKLNKENINQASFEQHLNNEINRKLKNQYAKSFFIVTILFSLISYGVVILNSILDWNIPEFAINALIIETPMQFFGILLIVARNLFPEVKQ